MLRITNLVKTFDAEAARRWGAEAAGESRVRAVDDVSFEVGEGELFTLLGPSGCGKTTTLRSVAGLEQPDWGEIVLGDRVLFRRDGKRRTNVPINRRGLGMVFQSYAIWPHMRVFDNVAFPLRCFPRGKHLVKRELREKVMGVLETMELGHLANRRATKLSGGQQQRLALARAIVTEPPLLLLDEPLSNLDAKLRESLRFELKRMQQELGITSVYVTHDQIEALALSSQIAVMCDGKIMQIGTPREIYQKPKNRFVAEFIGTSNFITGTVAGRDGADLTVDTEQGMLRVAGGGDVAVGKQVVLAVRPENVELSEGHRTEGTPNQWLGEVVTRSFLGDSVDHILRVGSIELRARCNPGTSLPAETLVTLHISPANLAFIPLDD